MNNRHLYNRIMEKIAVEVKRALNEDWGSKEDLWELSVNMLIDNLDLTDDMDYEEVFSLVRNSLKLTYQYKLPEEQLNTIINNFVTSICNRLGIDKDPINERFENVDRAYVMKDVEHRILYHYLGKGNKGLTISAQSKKSCNTSTDIRVWGNNIPASYIDKPVNIKVCRRKRAKENTHGFRVELNDDCTDIIGNNNPNYETTYIAFVVENPGMEDELNIYIHNLNLILETALNLQESGARWDEYRNQLKWYRKHNGIFLTNQYIKDKSIYVERLHFDPRDGLI